MIQRIILLKCCLFLGINSFGQNFIDLTRYSNTQLSGSARFDAMAGSFGALGADASAGLINPAGQARYSSSQFNIGLNNYSLKNSAMFNNTVLESQQASLRPNSIGLVASNDVSGNNSGFLYTQIGFSYNRIANFTNSWEYTGQQFASLLDAFCSAANGFAPTDLNTYFPMSTSLAWETYAIDEDGNGGYVPRLTMEDNQHTRNITTKGGLSEYTLSFSTNYMNKLYLGANWGIRTIRYTEDMQHSETLLDNSGVTLNSFDYFTNLRVKGTGHNLKLGFIYLPFEALRIGLSVHTPTAYELTEDYGADMIAYHKDGIRSIAEDFKPTGDFKYRLRTPGKIVGSLAYVNGTRGCINMDAEYMDYRWANLKATKDGTYDFYDYTPQNLEADTLLRPVLNVRVGGELVFQSQYFLRGGIGVYPQPYQGEIKGTNSATVQYSLGAGIKIERHSFDIAYRLITRSFAYFAFEQSRTDVKNLIQGLNVSYAINF
jgi:hypothetical protein